VLIEHGAEGLTHVPMRGRRPGNTLTLVCEARGERAAGGGLAVGGLTGDTGEVRGTGRNAVFGGDYGAAR
jgi:hypothetical protein